MSGDEVFACVVSVVITLVCWARWYWQVLAGRRGGGTRWVLALVPPICLFGLYFVLRRWASHDVRDDPVYLAFYLIMGAAWVGACQMFIQTMGINLRDDVTDRRNNAAAWMVAGVVIGLTASFAGANIGEGPGWWVVVFAALLSSGGLFLAWAIAQAITGAADTIAIDRDSATGIRLAVFLMAVGVLLGRAVAGDWVSVSATVDDFVRAAWPVLPLLVFEAVFGRLFRPSPHNPVLPWLTAGFVPALIYVGWALVALKMMEIPA